MANDRAPKHVTVGLMTRSPRVADRSPCLLPTDATGRHRSARYVGMTDGSEEECTTAVWTLLLITAFY